MPTSSRRQRYERERLAVIALVGCRCWTLAAFLGRAVHGNSVVGGARRKVVLGMHEIKLRLLYLAFDHAAISNEISGQTMVGGGGSR